MFVLAPGPVCTCRHMELAGFCLPRLSWAPGLALEQAGAWCPVLTYSSEGSRDLLLLTPSPTWVIWAIRESLFVFVTRSKQIPFHARTLCMMNDLLQDGCFVFLFSLFLFIFSPLKTSLGAISVSLGAAGIILPPIVPMKGILIAPLALHSLFPSSSMRGLRWPPKGLEAPRA